jgi:hypothetical protein
VSSAGFVESVEESLEDGLSSGLALGFGAVSLSYPLTAIREDRKDASGTLPGAAAPARGFRVLSVSRD